MTERHFIIQIGTIVADFDETELRIGLVGSKLRRRDTLYLGLVGIAQILRDVDEKFGLQPAVTVGYTNEKMAEFARRRFGMNVEAVQISDSEKYVYMITGDTGDLRGRIKEFITDERRARRLKRQALV